MKTDKKYWQQGYEAGLRHQEIQPENTEVLSWHAGFLEGRTDAEKSNFKKSKAMKLKKGEIDEWDRSTTISGKSVAGLPSTL